MAKYKVGEKVRGYGIRTGNLYTGTVITDWASTPGSECYIKIETQDGQKVHPGRQANIKNVERITEVSNHRYVENLVGPKPEPVEEPTHPTPWTNLGRRVLDSNGKVVLVVEKGNFNVGDYNKDLTMAPAYELARVIAEAVSEKYAMKVEDSKSPF